MSSDTTIPLVNFFIAGVQKGGTTALDGFLRRCPAVRMALAKEPHFFDDDTRDWSATNFEDYHALFGSDVGESVLVGEATPILSYWPKALERVAAYNPAARMILMLRHPSLRAHSHWRMETARQNETLAFRDAIRDAGRARVRSASNGVHRYFSYVERGFYSIQIERMRSLFPRQNLLFLRTDALWQEPDAVLRDTGRFLGVHLPQAAREPHYDVPLDTRDLGPMPVAEREYLDSLYAADIRRTAELTSVDLTDWLDPGYVEPMGTQTGLFGP